MPDQMQQRPTPASTRVGCGGCRGENGAEEADGRHLALGGRKTVLQRQVTAVAGKDSHKSHLCHRG